MRRFWKKTKKQNPEGMNLVASILVCYPEIGMASYDPNKQALVLTFEIRGSINEDDFQSFARFLAESVEAYHLLNGLTDSFMDITLESDGHVSFVKIVRDRETISRGEINIVAELFREHFGDELILESALDSERDPDFMAMQEDALDRMFVNLKADTIKDGVVGVRDDDRVVVYNR